MNKANSLNESARFDEAIALHIESIRIKEKLRDERGLIQSYNNIANVYTASGKPAGALPYPAQDHRATGRCARAVVDRVYGIIVWVQTIV